ncbi:tetratricopeptide repeat protein [Alistipes sp. OttesenSCG-928-B03]|nr:tetratricopeptide repeat protein [Alistipes sp. OttesenSCG-928-B03]
MMKRALTYFFALTVLALVSAGTAYAQKYPERGHVRKGNKEYAKGNYAQSEVEYKRALEKAPEMYEADFNLGNAFYKQERWDEASKIFVRLAADSASVENRAAAHYNAGNAYFQERKLQEALEEYKSSLRLNPGDMDAKFNLAYVKKMLEEQDQDGGGDGENDQDQDKDNQDQNDQNKDQQGDQDKEQQDKDQQGDQNKDQQGDKDKDDKGQQDKDDKGEKDGKDGQNDSKPEGRDGQQQGLSREEAAQMLQAVQAQEDRTREKVDDKEAKEAQQAQGASRRRW